MKYLEYWEKFFKTGKINDYLDYTACGLENSEGYVIRKTSEGGDIDNNDSNRNSFSNHANW